MRRPSADAVTGAGDGLRAIAARDQRRPRDTSVVRIILAAIAHEQGGVWHNVFDLASALNRSGHEVTIAGPTRGVAARERTSELGLRWRTVAASLVLPCDVYHLHLHDTYDLAALPLLAARRIAARSVVVTEHLPRTNASDASLLAHHPRRPAASAAKSQFKRAEAALANRIVVPSHGSRRFMIQRYSLNASRLRTVENGVEATDAPTPPPVAGRPLRVVCLGSLIVQKGQDILLDAARRSRHPWHVTFYGAGPGAELLNRGAAAQPERLRVRDWTADPLGAMRDAHLVCIPSRWEAFPYTALEAMSVGRPIVASAVDGLEDIVEHDATGLLVAPEDPSALAQAIDTIAEQPQRCALMGTRGYERVRGRFTIERMVSNTLSVYEEVTAERRQRWPAGRARGRI